jgi:hypothetical protein
VASFVLRKAAGGSTLRGGDTLRGAGAVQVDITHTTDALVKGTLDRQHTTDALVKGTLDVQHTTDALVKSTLDVQHTTDAYVRVGPIWQSTEESSPSGVQTQITITKPTGTAQGDGLIAGINTIWIDEFVIDWPTITPPSGWTLVRVDHFSRDTGVDYENVQQVIFEKVAGASEPANYTFTFSTSNFTRGTISRLTEVSVSPIVDAHSGATLSVTAPSITTLGPNRTLLFMQSNDLNTVEGPPSGMTERHESVFNAYYTQICDEPWKTASATGTRAVGTFAENIVALLAVKARGYDNPVVHTTDALVKDLDVDVTHTTDAYIQGAGAVDVTHTTDALVKGTLDRQHTTDAAVFGIPQNLTATAVSSSQIDLEWDDVPGADGYQVERDSVIVNYYVTVSNWSDTGLSPSTLYTYRVRAVRVP